MPPRAGEPPPGESQLPDFIGRAGPSAWHRLNPLTRLVLALGTTVAALAMGSVACLTLLGILAVALPAAVARELRSVLRTGALLSLPVALSAVLVNGLFPPASGTTLVEVGPVSVTAEGLRLAAVVVTRVLVIGGAVALFYRVTRASELVADLERRGLPARATFVIASAVSAVPELAERAASVSAAQRARGLDTEASPWRRLRGVAPIVGPTLLGAIARVEDRALALEARAFARPGRRTVLWAPRDSGAQRLARWAAVAGITALLVLPRLGIALPC